jgi:hypothetical protein
VESLNKGDYMSQLSDDLWQELQAVQEAVDKREGLEAAKRLIALGGEVGAFAAVVAAAVGGVGLAAGIWFASTGGPIALLAAMVGSTIIGNLAVMLPRWYVNLPTARRKDLITMVSAFFTVSRVPGGGFRIRPRIGPINF